MIPNRKLLARAAHKCEFCQNENDLNAYQVPDAPDSDIDDASVVVCKTCFNQITEIEALDPNHWRCLNESMWSTTPVVQGLAWQLLYKMRGEGWTQDLLDIFYLDEHTEEWAKKVIDSENKVIHKDANGNILSAGDTVTLIKDLKVKGASFTAKRGTAVRRISLVADNPNHIEGKVESQHIVILTQYVKKQ